MVARPAADGDQHLVAAQLAVVGRQHDLAAVPPGGGDARPSRTSTPARAATRPTASPAAGSSAGSSRSPRSTRVTCEPSRRQAVAISQPTTPPPRMSSRPGASLALVASRGVHGVDVPQPVDRRDGGRRAGAHRHGVPGGEPRLGAVGGGDDDGALAVEPAGAADQVDAGAVDPLHLAVVVPVRGEAVAPGQRRRDVLLAGDRLLRPVDRPRLGERLGAAQQRLARHARPVGALAADELVLDEDGGQPAADGDVGDVLPGRPAHR